MNTADCIDNITKERDYLGAANSIVENMIREKDLPIGKRKENQITIKVAKVLKEKQAKLRTGDSGLEPNEIAERVCTEGVMKARELLHLPNDM